MGGKMKKKIWIISIVGFSLIAFVFGIYKYAHRNIIHLGDSKSVTSMELVQSFETRMKENPPNDFSETINQLIIYLEEENINLDDTITEIYIGNNLDETNKNEFQIQYQIENADKTHDYQIVAMEFDTINNQLISIRAGGEKRLSKNWWDVENNKESGYMVFSAFNSYTLKTGDFLQYFRDNSKITPKELENEMQKNLNEIPRRT